MRPPTLLAPGLAALCLAAATLGAATLAASAAAPESHAVDAIPLAPSPQERLAEIGCPTEVLVGELDHEFRAPSEALARGIPDARLSVLPGAGHQPQHEAPGDWLAAVLQHLARARG